MNFLKLTKKKTELKILIKIVKVKIHLWMRINNIVKGSEEYYIKRGQQFEEENKISKAEYWYKQALGLNPKCSKANFHLAGLASK